MTGSRATLCRGILAGWTFAHVLCTPALAQAPAADETQAIVREAYDYLYPLVMMDVTRAQLLNSDPRTSAFGGPANKFVNIRAFPAAADRAVVRPNFDTLYSSAWLDLTSGPMVVSTA